MNLVSKNMKINNINLLMFNFSSYPHQVVASLLCRYAEFASALSSPLPSQSSVSVSSFQLPRPLSWSAPQHNLVKINVDFTIKNGRCFAGRVARAARGVVLHLVAVKLLILNVEAAEAFAVLLALRLALVKGWSRLIS